VGHPVDFATRSSSLDFSHLLEKLGSKVYHFSCSSLENEDRFIQEINAILDRGYDVVHLHTSYWKGLCAEKTAMERNCPLVIVHAHSTMVDLDDAEERTSAIALHENIKQAFLPSMANRFCACSIAAADWLFGNSIPRDKVRILKNAVDVDEFAFSPATRERVREELNLSDKLVLGHVGRFAFQKNHEMILDIFARIHEIDARAVLLLVGDGPLLEKTKRSAVERDLAGHIRFLGRRWDVANLMQAMDI
jgi:glycosyltransferase involved in cell wall biosynthesis